jgi:TatD DNase family protein
MLIDTHAHLDFPQFRDDLDQVLERAGQAGLVAILNAGTDEASSKTSVNLSKKYDKISASIGIHPHGSSRANARIIATLEEMAKDENVLAIGETGLDFYRNLSPRDSQENLFREQVRLACRVQKPLIVHSRQAHAETLKILKEENLPEAVGVMHCFSGDRHWAEAFLDLGFYISLAGPVTYPGSHDLRELAKFIPSDRLLLETDAPYLSPQAYRGKRNEPAYIKLTYERVALALECSLEDLALQVYLNAIRLFSDNLVD